MCFTGNCKYEDHNGMCIDVPEDCPILNSHEDLKSLHKELLDEVNPLPYDDLDYYTDRLDITK